MSSNRWHLYLHAAPLDRRDSVVTSVGGAEVPCLQLEPADQAHELSVSFDAFLTRLETLPGSYVEWDGSFVWRPEPGPQGPLIEGNAFDGQVGLQNVELKIHGESATLEPLLELLDWPAQSLVVQIVNEGVYVEVATLLRLLQTTKSVE